MKQQLNRWRLKIQNDLNNYIFLENEIKEKENETLGVGAQVIDDMPRGGESLSNTEKQALKIMHDLEELRHTKKSIEMAYSCLESILRDYFYMRYFKEFSPNKIQRELFITDRTYRNYNTRIIIKVGKEMGLIE